MPDRTDIYVLEFDEGFVHIAGKVARVLGPQGEPEQIARITAELDPTGASLETYLRVLQILEANLDKDKKGIADAVTTYLQQVDAAIKSHPTPFKHFRIAPGHNIAKSLGSVLTGALNLVEPAVAIIERETGLKLDYCADVLDKVEAQQEHLTAVAEHVPELADVLSEKERLVGRLRALARDSLRTKLSEDNNDWYQWVAVEVGKWLDAENSQQLVDWIVQWAEKVKCLPDNYAPGFVQWLSEKERAGYYELRDKMVADFHAQVDKISMAGGTPGMLGGGALGFLLLNMGVDLVPREAALQLVGELDTRIEETKNEARS
jgi:hypothetical protein